MKTATYGQIKDVAIRVLNLKLDGIDGGAIQRGTEGFSVDDIDRRIVAFLNNGLNFVIKNPNPLIIDRTKPFDTANFIGQEVTIWRGPINDTGLVGEEAQDIRSLKLTKIDFTQVLFEHCLKEGENAISGWEKLKRHIAAGHIRLDAKIGQCLFEEKGQATLKWLYHVLGITKFELTGTVLRTSGGSPCFLALYRNDGDGGQWRWTYGWFGDGRGVEDPSAVLAS